MINKIQIEILGTNNILNFNIIKNFKKIHNKIIKQA